MLAIILAACLNSAPVATAAWHVTAAIESAQQARADRAQHTAELGRWLDAQDGIRIRAAARYSPFADDSNPNPFEEN